MGVAQSKSPEDYFPEQGASDYQQESKSRLVQSDAPVVAQNSDGAPYYTSSYLVGSNCKVPREKGRYGFVQAKVTSLSFVNSRLRGDNNEVQIITPKGTIFHGTQSSATGVKNAMAAIGVPVLVPNEYQINDSRAHRLLVTYNNGWYAVPSQDPFSRHSGTCLVLGDKSFVSLNRHPMQLGDCFRLGSVGLVVSEIRYANGDEERLDGKTLQYLKDEALAFDCQDELATLAAEEEEIMKRMQMRGTVQMDNAEDLEGEVVVDSEMLKNSCSSQEGDETGNKSTSENIPPISYGVGGLTQGERFICYMCYETHNDPADPLVAPCDCRGDTRYLHVQCLQRFINSCSTINRQHRVTRTNGNGSTACKICGATYKTSFKRPDGKKYNLLESDCQGAYISLTVVTRHDTSPGLFNTKFRLSFGPPNDTLMPFSADINDDANSLLIGRSSSCHMVLDYRTVSTVHAIISYHDDKFYIKDNESSNGTMVYLKEPLPLKYSEEYRIRMGRTTLILTPKRNWSATIRDMLTFKGLFATSSVRFGKSGSYRTLSENNQESERVSDSDILDKHVEEDIITSLDRISKLSKEGFTSLGLKPVNVYLSLSQLLQIMSDNYVEKCGNKVNDHEKSIHDSINSIGSISKVDGTLEPLLASACDPAAKENSSCSNSKHSSGKLLPHEFDYQDQIDGFEGVKLKGQALKNHPYSPSDGRANQDSTTTTIVVGNHEDELLEGIYHQNSAEGKMKDPTET